MVPRAPIEMEKEVPAMPSDTKTPGPPLDPAALAERFQTLATKCHRPAILALTQFWCSSDYSAPINLA
jgi:hypothetical protein